MKTPVRLPARVEAGRPASSTASQVSSSSSRCCGSIWSASRGEMPKKAASNAPMSGRTPAAQV